MPDIVIFTGGYNVGDVSGFKVSGEARVNVAESENIGWETGDISYDATPSQINAAIVAAAIAAADVAGHVVGGGDNKIVIGGAPDLG